LLKYGVVAHPAKETSDEAGQRQRLASRVVLALAVTVPQDVRGRQRALWRILARSVVRWQHVVST